MGWGSKTRSIGWKERTEGLETPLVAPFLINRASIVKQLSSSNSSLEGGFALFRMFVFGQLFGDLLVGKKLWGNESEEGL